MILFLRALARLVGFLLLVALAVLGLAVAVFCIQGGDGTLSLASLAELLRLHELRESVAELLDGLEHGSSMPWGSLLGGVAAILLGLALLAGVLVRRRERLVTVAGSDGRRLAARRRPLAQVAAALAEQARGVTSSSVRVRPRRRRQGGRIKVKTVHSRRAKDAEVRERVERELNGLSSGFSLRPKVRTQLGEGARRVE